MRYAVFADIHANLEALTTVLEFFRAHKTDAYLCAGDIVGYGPNPNECVDLVKSLPNLSLVAGNHDWASAGMKDLTWFNENAQKSLIWTRQHLSENHKIYLSELPKLISEKDFTLVHGSPRDPLDEYLLTHEQYHDMITNVHTPVTFVGHSHTPFIFDSRSVHLFRRPGSLLLDESEQYVVNPGSVGQPRDRNSQASCGVYDTYTHVFQLARLEYNVAATQKKMRDAGLPNFLTERLSLGR
jgi:predicted phosphodiesterase